jgi:hypothetical protein
MPDGAFALLFPRMVLAINIAPTVHAARTPCDVTATGCLVARLTRLTRPCVYTDCF